MSDNVIDLNKYRDPISARLIECDAAIDGAEAAVRAQHSQLVDLDSYRDPDEQRNIVISRLLEEVRELRGSAIPYPYTPLSSDALACAASYSTPKRLPSRSRRRAKARKKRAT